jgi:hypothetical protein
MNEASRLTTMRTILRRNNRRESFSPRKCFFSGRRMRGDEFADDSRSGIDHFRFVQALA